LKIAHLTTVHPVNDNRIFYKECKTLAASGYDVTLVCAGALSTHKEGVSVVGFPKVSSRIARLMHTSFFDLLKVCKEVDADIYHFHDPEIIFAGFWLKMRGKKVVYDIHENNPASILSKPYIDSKIIKSSLSSIFNLFERMAVHFFDAIITARPDISARFKHKHLVTLRNFPIVPELSAMGKKKIEKKKPSVIFVGGMTHLRGIDHLLDAFEQLDDYTLWLLGPVAETALQDRIAKGCANVEYFGVVEAFEVFDYIQQADIGIITFLPVPNHVQTLATKPFEYMACGKPMIMSNFEYWQKTFGDSSLYVDPFDTEDIVQKVKQLLNDKVLMSQMGMRNLTLSHDEYNWTKESKKLLALYEELSK